MHPYTHTHIHTYMQVHIAAMPEFHAREGADWLYLSTHYDLEGIFGVELLQLLGSHRATLGTADRAYMQVQELVSVHANPVVVLPYKAMYPTEAFARQQLLARQQLQDSKLLQTRTATDRGEASDGTSSRSADALFLGNMRRGAATLIRYPGVICITCTRRAVLPATPSLHSTFTLHLHTLYLHTLPSH